MSIVIVAGFAFAGAVALTVVCTSSAETFVEEKNADTEVYAVKMDDSEVKSKVSPKKGEYVVEVTEINGKKHTFVGKKN